ncbi:MAG: nifE1 [Oscillospiraceae bacterium]|nr:nifE1 [Oscillospiraceae bacterium]
MATKLLDALREDRPGFTSSQGGPECYLRGKSRGGCLKPADRTFAQTTQCQQMNAIATLLSMEDSVFIVHAPDGCSGCASMFNESYKVGQYHRGKRVAKNAHIVSSSFDENDVIMGGETKLRTTIRSVVQRYQPKIVFLFSSCSSGIIGDDIDAVAAELQKDYDSTVIIPIHCEGFKSKIHSTGFDVVFNAIQNYIIGDDRPETEEGLVNIFATTSIGYADQLELERMLKAIGLKVNYIPFFSSYEKLKKIPAAEYSVSVCQVFADTYMKFLYEEYGIPYVITGMPVGTRSTDRWLTEIAKMVGKEEEAAAFLARERAAVLPEIESLREKIQGRRVFVCTGTGRGVAAATLIEDYNMKLVGIQSPTYEDAYVDDYERLAEFHGDDFIIDVATMQPFEQVNLVNRLKPDFFIGIGSWVDKLGIPNTHILEPKRPTFGYRGVVYLGRKIATALENTAWADKMAAHRKLPYRDSWYQQDAFHYMKREEDEE